MGSRAAVAVGLATIALSACGDGDAGGAVARMTVEIAGPELIVYVDDPDATAATGRRVELICVAHGGEVVLRRTEPWPFTDTDGGQQAPHVHTPLGEVRPDDVARCDLGGTELSAVPSLAR